MTLLNFSFSIVLLLGSVRLSPTVTDESAQALQRRYAKAIELFKGGDLAAAENEFRSISQLAPQMAEPYYYLARIAVAQSSLGEAQRLLRKALQLKPDFVEARHTLGVTSFQQGNYLQARELFLRVIHQDPRFALAYVNLGSAYLGLQRPDEAITHFRKALEISPVSREVAWRANLQLGLIYYDRREHLRALECLEQALRANPNDPEVLFLLARAYAALNDPRTVDVLRKCVAVDPKLHDAWEALGQELLKRKAFAEAIATFEGYVQTSPDHPLPHILLGEALMQRHDLPGALSEFQRAVQLAPRLARAQFSVGFIYKEMGQNELARRFLQEALQLDPNLALANFHLAELLSEQDQLEEARRLFERSVRIKPDYAEAHIKLGHIYLKQQSYAAALDALSKGIHLQPDAAQPYYVLGRVYLGLGQQQKASEAFQKFKQLEERENPSKKID